MNKKIIGRSFLNAFGLLVYVAIVSTVLNSGEKIFGGISKTLGGMAFILIFVFSASVAASLVLGKPTLMYLEGEKKDGVKMFFYTIGWIFIFVVLFGVSGFLFGK